MGIFYERSCSAAALSLILFSPALLAAVANGSASGWIEVKGKRVNLTHAFAVMSEDVLAGPGKERIEVLLSDNPVPEDLRKATGGWSMWAGDKAQTGELHGIILYLNPQTKAWSGGQRLSTNGLEFYSQSVSSPELSDLVFMPAAAGANEIAGKVSMKEPMNGAEEDSGPWRAEAEFRATVLPRPAVTGNYTGAEARASEPYRAVQTYLQACQKKDLAAIRNSLAASSRKMMDKFEAARGKQAVLEMVVGDAAETSKLKLIRVTVRGDAAEVELAGDKDSGQQVMRLVLENGAWKIGQ